MVKPNPLEGDFPPVSLKDARIAPYHARPSHLAKVPSLKTDASTLRYAGPIPLANRQGVTLAQWNQLRAFARSLAED
jgi:hypothetical protein